MTLSELIERVEKLDGPDEAVDAEICVALQYGGKNSEHAANVRTDPDWNGDLLFEIGNMDCCNPIPELTASLDAAIALTERVLPGWFWRAGRTSLFPKGWAYVSRTHPSHCDRKDEASSSDGKAASPAIALLLATLRALSAQERDDGR